MKNLLKTSFKYLLLWIVFGSLYFIMEILFRGYSHWSMFITGGICGILLDLINEVLDWDTPLWKQMILGGLIITLIELLVGEILTRVFSLQVWDYSDLPLNFDGVICLSFSLLWCMISPVGIILGDYIRYYLFKEEKPRYVLF